MRIAFAILFVALGLPSVALLGWLASLALLIAGEEALFAPRPVHWSAVALFAGTAIPGLAALAIFLVGALRYLLAGADAVAKWPGRLVVALLLAVPPFILTLPVALGRVGSEHAMDSLLALFASGLLVLPPHILLTAVAFGAARRRAAGTAA